MIEEHTGRDAENNIGIAIVPNQVGGKKAIYSDEQVLSTSSQI